MSYAPSLTEIHTIRAFAKCQGDYKLTAHVLSIPVPIIQARIKRLASKAGIKPYHRSISKDLAISLFAWFQETESILEKMMDYRLAKAKEPAPSDPMDDPAF